MRSCLEHYAASRFDALICLLPENYLINLAITIPCEDESRLRKDAYEGGLPGPEARVRLPQHRKRLGQCLCSLRGLDLPPPLSSATSRQPKRLRAAKACRRSMSAAWASVRLSGARRKSVRYSLCCTPIVLKTPECEPASREDLYVRYPIS